MTYIPKDYFDQLLLHKTRLMRYSNHISYLVTNSLYQSNDKIYYKIMREPPMRTLIKDVREIRQDTWDFVADRWKSELDDFIDYEKLYIRHLIQDSIQDKTKSANVENVIAVTLIMGKLFKDWMKYMSYTDISRINSTIRYGKVQNQTNKEIINEIKNTVDARVARDIQNLSRTTVMTYANEVDERTYIKNSDYFSKEIYIAVLDSRTTKLCTDLNGTTYPPKSGPHPPMHFKCRSFRVPLFKDSVGVKGIVIDEKKWYVDDIQALNFKSWVNGLSKTERDEVIGKLEGMGKFKGEYLIDKPKRKTSLSRLKKIEGFDAKN